MLFLTAIAAVPTAGFPQAEPQETPPSVARARQAVVACSSKLGERQYCPADTSKGVALGRSRGHCDPRPHRQRRPRSRRTRRRRERWLLPDRVRPDEDDTGTGQLVRRLMYAAERSEHVESPKLREPKSGRVLSIDAGGQLLGERLAHRLSRGAARRRDSAGGVPSHSSPVLAAGLQRVRILRATNVELARAERRRVATVVGST